MTVGSCVDMEAAASEDGCVDGEPFSSLDKRRSLSVFNERPPTDAAGGALSGRPTYDLDDATELKVRQATPDAVVRLSSSLSAGAGLLCFFICKSGASCLLTSCGSGGGGGGGGAGGFCGGARGGGGGMVMC